MARLRGPDDGSRLVYVVRGTGLHVAAGMSAVMHAAETGDTLADILYDADGTPGSPVPGSALVVDSFGLLPDFWLPDPLVDRVWAQCGTGPRTAVYAATDPRIDALDTRVAAVEGGVAAALPLTGGTLTGPLTVLPGSGGVQNALVLGDGSVSRVIYMRSSYDGGQDTAANTLKFDSTSRIEFECHQQAFNQSYGEPLRFNVLRADAKAAITWQGPTAWNPWTPDPGNPNNLLGGDGANSSKRWAWIVAHYQSNDHNSVHGHLSVELPDAAGNLQTRLEFPIWSPAGTFGMDQANIKTNLSHFTVRASNSFTGTPNYLRVAGSTTYPKYIEFSLSTEPSVSPNQVRFQVGVNTDTESGSNSGSNFVIRRHTDNGSFNATALFLGRANGNASFGSAIDEGARVAAVWSSSGDHGFLAKPSASITSFAAFASVLQTSNDRVGDHRVAGDTTARLAWFLNRVEFGDGTNPRDVTLYRNAADELRTDDSLIVGPRLTVNSTLDATSVIRANTDGSVAGLRVVATADGTASTGVVIIHPSTANKRAIDVRLAADTTSRLRVDTAAGGGGRITLGDGTTADVTIYKNNTAELKTDSSLIVGGTSFAVNGGLDATSVIRSYTDGTRPAARFSATADGTASTGVLVVNPFSVNKRAVDIRLSADSVSRLRVDLETATATGSGMITFGDGTTSDVSVWRSAATTLKTGGKFLATGGLGVGNSAVATTPGTVTRKIEVFDAAGASLGFVPVYNAIT